METKQRQKDKLIKLVKWYKSAFKVEIEEQKLYEFETNPKTRVPIKDPQGNKIYKMDENGEKIKMLNNFGKHIEIPINTKVYENKIASSQEWLSHKYPEYVDRKTDEKTKEAIKQNEPQWVKKEDLPSYYFIQSLKDGKLKKEALKMYQVEKDKPVKVKDWIEFQKNDCLKIEFFFNRYMD